MPPIRWPAGCRRGAGRSPLPRAVSSPSQRDTGRDRSGSLDEQAAAAESTRSRHPVRAPARVVRRAAAGPRGWWPGPSRVDDRARIASIMSAAASRRARSCRTPAAAFGPPTLRPTLSAMLMPACWVMPKYGRDCLGDRRGITDRRPARSATHRRGNLSASGRDLERQSRLAHPADAGQRHQPVRLQRRLPLRRSRTRGRRSLSWASADFPASASSGLQRWKVSVQAGGVNLKHCNGFGDIA